MPSDAPSGRLAPWRFDPVACLADLDAFEQLLAVKMELSEREDILPFFRAHPHMAACLGSYAFGARMYDRLGLEVPLFGQFTADLVAGDRRNKAYCLVEFEDARSNSIFARRGRHTTEWAARFYHGFGQIVDWLWLLDDLDHALTLEDHFGPRPVSFTTVLIVGRDHHLSDLDRRRLQWHSDRVVVNSHHAYCYTFDDLLRGLRSRLNPFQTWSTAASDE